jgi:hypothetical protein
MAYATLPNNGKRFQSVYIAASESGLIKIGISFDPEERIKALFTGHGVGLSIAHVESMDDDSARLVERASHKMLADSRSSGEWFKVSVEEAVRTVCIAKLIVADCRKSIPPCFVEKIVYVDREVIRDVTITKTSFIRKYIGYYEGTKLVLLWCIFTAIISIFIMAFTDFPMRFYEREPLIALVFCMFSLFSFIYPSIGMIIRRDLYGKPTV